MSVSFRTCARVADGCAHGPSGAGCSTALRTPAASAWPRRPAAQHRVLNLDLSKSALTWGQENTRANGFEPDPHDFVFGDVFDWLARFARREERFDLIILDPPGFSRTKSGAFSAAQNYDALATLAARVTAPDGLILACCNVAELPRRAFRERVLAGLAAAGRTAEIMGIHHEPALDFPAAPGQDPYLKMLWLQL